MLANIRKDHSGVITLHQPVPAHLLHHTSPRNVQQMSSSVVEFPYVRKSLTQKSSRVVPWPGTEADETHTLSPCSVKQLQDQFLSERREADAITRPLLDTENGFIKDLERFLDHSDMLSVRKRELLHKRWTECVWWPVQRSVEHRVTHRRYEGAEPKKVSSAPLEDPLFLHSLSGMKEKRTLLHCRTGCGDECQWAASAEEQSRSRYGDRSRGPVSMATADGRCFRPECWSALSRSRSYSIKSLT